MRISFFAARTCNFLLTIGLISLDTQTSNSDSSTQLHQCDVVKKYIFKSFSLSSMRAYNATSRTPMHISLFLTLTACTKDAFVDKGDAVAQ